MSDDEAAQMARVYLLYLFGVSLFPNRRSRVHFCYLAGLVDLGQAGRFDWGGAALCTLYCFLGAASRGVGDTIGGYWRLVELWAYEALGMFPRENTCQDPGLYPRGLAWGKTYKGTKERRGEVMTFRRWLDNLTEVAVHWDRWARLEAEFLPRSREVTQSRVLLKCPLGWQWTESYTRAELELFTVPDTNLERHFRRTLEYAAYVGQYLATSLGVEEEFERRVAGVGARRDETGAGSRGGRSIQGRGRGARLPAGGRGAGPSDRGEGSAGALEMVETPVPPVLPVLKWTIGMTSPSGAREVIHVPRLSQLQMRLPAQVPREWAEQVGMLMVGMRHLLKDCAKGRVLQTRHAPESVSPVVPRAQPRRSARTHPQGTTSLPVPASTRGRGTQSVPRSAVGARGFVVLPRAESQRRPVLEESEESEEGTRKETEESSESRILGTSDSSTASGSPSEDDDDDGDESESAEPEGQQRKRTRRD
ncbi:hypothetical protein RHMOL_Rhmol02G0195400 [Rhododendron molle]|uniref:Uncharacterized protein n=1 Tax=Rhododendron molle TaxID=49168 RepID=A0ACC0PUD7_RHOML|nr:hypothetical protein RHMOL_Rhmol02G0195400 [Rhododendron molle]